VDGDVADRLAATFQHAAGIGKLRAAVESQVHMGGVGGDMAEAILERLAGEREADGDSISVDVRFDRCRRFVENYLSEGQGEPRDMRIVRRQVA
jgi:hypothetical protein